MMRFHSSIKAMIKALNQPAIHSRWQLGSASRHFTLPCATQHGGISSVTHTNRVPSMSTPPGKSKIRGAVFDMDGTVTVSPSPSTCRFGAGRKITVFGVLQVPVINFADMRRRVGVPDGQDILDYVSSLMPEQKIQALATIADIEAQALKSLQLMPGAVELCRYLDMQQVPRGLITRNVKSSIVYFHDNHFMLPPFMPAISRECGHPYKPSPAALQHICKTWGIAPHECIMLGDSVKDDVVSGNRAGAITILLDYQGQHGYSTASFEGEMKPHYVVHSLLDVVEILQQDFEVSS